MPACADLVVEGAVDFVLLGAKDGGQIVGHGGRCAVTRVEGRKIRTEDRSIEEDYVGGGGGGEALMGKDKLWRRQDMLELVFSSGVARWWQR